MNNDAINISEGLKTFGKAVSILANHNSYFEHKVEKHINNPDKLAGYLCFRYSSNTGEFAETHIGDKTPNIEDIKSDKLAMRAVEAIKAHGYKVKVGEWPEIGKQLIIVKPNNKCYHSDYKWEVSK